MAIVFLNNLLTPGLDPQVVYSRMVFRPEYCMHSAFFILRPYWLFIHSPTALGAESSYKFRLSSVNLSFSVTGVHSYILLRTWFVDSVPTNFFSEMKREGLHP